MDAAKTLAEDLVNESDSFEYNEKVSQLVSDILNVSLDTMTIKATSKTVAEIKAKAKDAIDPERKWRKYKEKEYKNVKCNKYLIYKMKNS